MGASSFVTGVFSERENLPSDPEKRREFVASAVLYNQTRLLPMLTQITHDAAAAEDILQETAIYALDNAQHLTQGNQVYGWLAGIGLKLANDYLRNLEKHKSVSLDSTSVDWRQLPTFHTHQSPLETTLQSERIDQVRQAISELAPTLNVVVYQILDGKTIPEAARQLGIPETTAKSRYRTAKRELRRVLQL